MIAGALGFFSGMAADLDIFIRSPADPLMYLDFHRHFTHSFVFIPVGGLLSALVLHVILARWWKLPFARTFWFCTLGYATHAILDACTSYGTRLFWPFSDERVAFNIVSVIDPLFTVPMLILVGVATWRRSPWPARAALAWGFLYLSLGVFQNQAAHRMASALATERGDTPMRITVKPSFGNLLVWRSIYETPTHYHVDAIRATIRPRVFEGASALKLDVARDFPWLDPSSQQARDIERFRHFSDDFLALAVDDPSRVIDVRYAFLPTSLRSLWSIQLSPDAPATAHAGYLTHRGDARVRVGDLWAMIAGD